MRKVPISCLTKHQVVPYSVPRVDYKRVVLSLISWEALSRHHDFILEGVIQKGPKRKGTRGGGVRTKASSISPAR